MTTQNPPVTCGRCAAIFGVDGVYADHKPAKHATDCPGRAREVREYRDQANGSLHLHRFNRFAPIFLATDGAKLIADQCGAYWLLDAIASHHLSPKVRNEPFQSWHLEQNPTLERGVILWADDGNGNELVRQFIPYSDFPRELLPLNLYCEQGGALDGKARTIMMPEER